MDVIVPFTDRDPKSRLKPVLGAAERRKFAFAMLQDVVTTIEATGHEPELLVPRPLDVAESAADTAAKASEAAEDDAVPESVADRPTIVDDRPLTPAVNGVLSRVADGDTAAVAIVMADLALATPTALHRLFSAGGDVAIAPGRGGGTNALVVRDPGFAVDYHGTSYRDHHRAAAEAGLAVGVVDSMRLASDVDEPADLVEVLLHTDGRSAAWLREAGFEVDDSESRVGVQRGTE
ncbi:MAG: 2-phospho-L-lactate guanylyltransferase [Halobellus sp.]|uniref:2-phospho-L-lactate guanylyltransferase n=1 Tax=Halobellus sp. TaxID=1979212 RepID=UPI0035D4D926